MGPQGGKANAIAWTFWRERWRERRIPKTVSTKLQKIAELAKKAPEMHSHRLTTTSILTCSWKPIGAPAKDGAPGIDGQTAKKYEEKLFDNLGQLAQPL